MMPENESQNDDQNEHGLIPGGALPAISAKSSGPLDEMVERSLVSIRTSKELSAKHRIGEHELYGPDYRLVCVWAEETGMSKEEVLEELLEQGSVIENGRFRELILDHGTLPVKSLMPKIEGLVVKEMDATRGGFTAIDLSAVPNLTELWCNKNQLTALDLSAVPSLTWLECGVNELTALDIRPARELNIFVYDKDKTRLIQRPDQGF